MFPSIENLNLSGKKVLIRVDFNIPLDKKRCIMDDTRLKAAQKTIQYVLEKGGAAILMSHLGRPKGERREVLSLKIVVSRLEEILNRPVFFVEDCVGDKVLKAKKDLKAGEVLLLENLRFYVAEEKPAKNPDFAKELVQNVDCYVNEAFSCSHRAHTSITEVPKYLKASAFGFEHIKELEAYYQYLERPKRPFVALVGGAKISSKISALKALLDKVDTLLIAGAMAHTFFSAQGHSIGQSLHEPELEREVLEILQYARDNNILIKLPTDLGVTLSVESSVQYISIDQVPKEAVGVDIGPKTVKEFKKVLKEAKTIFWNGPLGIFEKESSAKGTLEIAQFLSSVDGVTYVGGGDSTAALHQAGVDQKMTFVSTGGGASLELIEKGSLPGIDILMHNS